jgi:deoxyribodipyrimidine photolyase-related protein
MNTVDSPYVQEAKEYVRKNFADNYGLLDTYGYDVTHRDAELLLKDFVTHRLSLFGPYEDAISDTHTHIQHSVLSPYLNVGLLTPKQVLDAVLEHNAPIQSVEGFVRQVLGWREFIRAMYDIYGVEMRTKNFFGHTKKLPQEFWTADTKNKVLDTTIERVLAHAYCHHIERLMILGNYMLLSETDPYDVYRWFMELFIDSYDWVMVPNVYGMSQFADGGIFATKPYICASNYIQKMSNYKKDGVWDKEYDQKFWEFLKKHKDFFSKNPRFKMLVSRIGK